MTPVARANLGNLIYKASPIVRHHGKDPHAQWQAQKQTRVQKLQETQDVQDAQDDAPVVADKGPKRLYHLFAALERRHGKWVVAYKKDQRMRTCFKKLHQKFEELKAIGLDVDEVDYICAHKATYGEALRPNHLISWCSLGIYQSYLADKHAEKIEVSPEEQDAYDTAMVQYLMQVRGETKAAVVKLLKSCDLL